MQKLSFFLLIALLAAALVVPAAFAQDQTAQPAQAPAAQPDQSAQPAQAPAAVPDQSAQPSAAPAAGQDQSAQPAQAPSAGAAGAADVMNQTSFTGCLTGTDDNYVLRDDKSGELFRLHSDKDIDEHVGKKVIVTGKVQDEHRERESQAQAGSEAAAGAKIPQHGINVEDIKDAGSGCESPK